MKPESARARRRHQRWRMVQRAVRLFRMWDAAKWHTLDERGLDVKRRPFDPERLADNLCACSCLFCRAHRREVSGPTMRERRFAEDRNAAEVMLDPPPFPRLARPTDDGR